MPELSLVRRARRRRQADPPRAHGGLGGRLDGDHARRRSSRAAATRRVLTLGYEKQSEGNATWALGGGRSGSQGAGGSFAPWIRNYIQRSGAPEHIGWKVAVKDRLNALQEPLRAPAHARHHDREGEGVPDALGPAPLPRVVPVVGRRGGDGAHQRRGREARAAAAGLGDRARQAHRVLAVPGPRHRASPWPASTARRRSTRRPASPTRAARSTAPSSTCRSRGTSRCGSRAT